MQIVAVGADCEQWHTKAAPSCWCSTGDGWTTSSCVHRLCTPTDAAENHVQPVVWLSHIYEYHPRTDEDRNHVVHCMYGPISSRLAANYFRFLLSVYKAASRISEAKLKVQIA